jgi:D-alanyl-D-alanine carboxypeptidase/D-alanyl-D-alanine-endopeptidase (penicillin-binding protein 4)
MLTWGAVALLLAAMPAVAGAQASSSLHALRSALRSGMRQIGGASGAYVVDMTTGQTLFARHANVGRMPASVEKLYTTSTALLEWGPQATLTTSVLGIGSLDTAGIWHGTLYLKGGGDPTLGSVSFDDAAYGTGATMRQLVANLLQAVHITGVQGQIVGDGSYFDQHRGTPATHFRADLPDVEGQLGALVFNRGFANFSGTAAQSHPVLYAAQRFINALRFAGVSVPSTTPIYGGPTPSTAQLLTTISSPPIATLIKLTNTPSDNFFAEMLLKDLGAQFGGAGTTAAGAGVVRAELQSKFGITPQLIDGSGLARADSTSPRQVVTLLEQMYSDPYFFNSLAIAGRTGTLQHEARGTAAQGACHGKTGTLHDVAALAGYCRARDGHELAFAFLANGLWNPDYVHQVEANTMAAALARYSG